MPTNSNFSFSVQIGSHSVTEYEKDGVYYVESNLFTPFSYEQEVRELVYDEVEVQNWPVTPYQVSVTLHPGQDPSAMHLSIDGVRICNCVLTGGSTHVFKGFLDSEGKREFLFSLPRFAKDENDRVASERLNEVGTIKVKQYTAKHRSREYHYNHRDTDFNQANKKDAIRKTGGSYTLSTTKKGRIISPTDPAGFVTRWVTGDFVGELSVHYRMGYTLQEMGILPRPLPSVNSVTVKS